MCNTHTLTEIETISIKDSEVYPTHIGTPVSQQLQELQASFATKPLNSWPLGVYLFNFCLILNESLFKRHKPSTQQRQLWPKLKCHHPAEKSFKLLTRKNKDVKTLPHAHTNTHAHTQAPCPPSISVSAMPQVPSYTTEIVFLMRVLKGKIVTVQQPLALFRPPSVLLV